MAGTISPSTPLSCSARNVSIDYYSYPKVWSAGAKGCMLQVSGHVTGCISTVAFSFIVQDPDRRGDIAVMTEHRGCNMESHGEGEEDKRESRHMKVEDLA